MMIDLDIEEARVPSGRRRRWPECRSPDGIEVDCGIKLCTLCGWVEGY